MNISFLINRENINIFTQETLRPFFILRKSCRSSSESVFNLLDPLFTTFLPVLIVGEVHKILNKYQLSNEPAKY